MFRWPRSLPVLTIYGLFVSVSAFLTARAVYLIPSDPKNDIFWGLSLQRLILIGAALLAAVLAAVLAIKTYRDKAWAKRIWDFIFGSEKLSLGICLGAGAVLLSGWIVYFLPLYRWENNLDYYLRVSPLVVWLIFVSALTFVIACVEKFGFDWGNFANTIRAHKKVWAIAFTVTILFLLIWAFIALTGMGTWVSDGYWYGAGVPVLSLQIVLVFVLGMAAFFLERSSFKKYLPAWTDVLIFFLLWGVTAFLWAREPMSANFFAPGPYPPDYQFHPFSDAATFDRGSQFALIGQGINNGQYFDRALYMAFLVFLHSVIGQNYTSVVALQAAIYAVFPGILYLLGKAIYNRPFGLTIAVLAMVRGVTGIAVGTLIDLANQKQMLTDFPTVIFVAWFTLMVVKWLKSPDKNYLYLIWAGGVVGLGIMLRTNMLFLLLFAALLIAIVYWRQKLRGILIGILVVVAMFASTFAWGAYHGKSVFDIYIYRILLVIRARYPQSETPLPEPQGNESTPNDVVLDKTSPVISTLGTGLASPVHGSSPTQNPETRAKVKPIPVFVTIHFLHNVISSVFILPTDSYFHDVWRTVRGDFPYWDQYWDGRFAANAHYFLLANLFLIALGIGASWKSARLAGLAPLGAFFFYDLANAFARTSGGRYVVPIDWIVLFYFALGLFQVILWGMAFFGLRGEPEHSADQASWSWGPLKKKSPLIVVFFLFLGSLIPLSGHFIPRRYPERSQEELFALLESQGDIQKMGLDPAELQAALAQWPELRIVDGRALYPRYFDAGDGIPKNRFPYNAMDFSRIAFTMIGPQGVNYALLPRTDVDYFPNGSDVFVLGCQQGLNINALAVVIVDQPNIVYTRRPAASLQCPLLP